MLSELIENLLNRRVGESPRAIQLLGVLRNRAMRVQVRGTALAVTVESLGKSLRVSRQPPVEPPAVTVDGTVFALLQLVRREATQGAPSGVRIAGDGEVAEQYQALLRLLGPDVEEELARIVGDLPAHQLARAAGGMLAFGRRGVRTTVSNVFEFLAHESGDLVPIQEARQFFERIDALREDADRLEARCDLLMKRLDEAA
ncbi:MAG: hypothetical protein R3E77_01485 [Steroidobacteraceae bacterium]